MMFRFPYPYDRVIDGSLKVHTLVLRCFFGLSLKLFMLLIQRFSVIALSWLVVSCGPFSLIEEYLILWHLSLPGVGNILLLVSRNLIVLQVSTH